jgi:hypothetical protein
MKNVKLYEEFTQDLSEAITLDEFKALKPGQLVHYMGTAYKVEKPGDVTVVLKDEEDETIEVNYNMFKAKGFVNQI